MRLQRGSSERAAGVSGEAVQAMEELGPLDVGGAVLMEMSNVRAVVVVF